jgi:putative aldouronate transport system substrate-binding protein
MAKKSFRIASLLIAAAMMAGICSACSGGSEESSGQSENGKLSFKVLSLDYPDGFDDFPMVKEAKEEFNVDFEIQQVAWDNWDETVRTLAATGSLPEVIAWYNLNYSEYSQWVDQGVFKKIPDLSAYPEIKEVTESMDVTEKLKIDGDLYAIPKKAITQPFNKFINKMMIYRRDWAREMGYDFDPVQEITYDEFVSYLKDLKAKDPGGLGDKLVPFDQYHGGLSWVEVVGMWNPNVDQFYKTEDGSYEWGARDAATLEGIEEMKKLYDEGLLMKDGYADKQSAGDERFTAGRSGVFYGDRAVAALINTVDGIKKTEPDFKDEDLGVFAVRMPSGKFVSKQMSEWWAAYAFSSSCSDEVMDRWLQIGNWLLEDDQVKEYAYGTKGTDWTEDESGNVTLNWTAEDIVQGGSKDYISQQRIFQKFFILEGMDYWIEGNPSIRDYLQNDLYKAYFEFMEEAEKRGEVDYYPNDYDIQFFSGPNKDQYGNITADVQSAVIKAIVADDPEKTWNEYLDSKKTEMDSVIQELDEGLGK